MSAGMRALLILLLAMLAGYLATLADFLPHRKDPS